MNEPEGSGWLIFAGIMIGLGGVLSIIWGVAAIEQSSFFASGGHYLITSLKTWGWIVLIIGILELCASFSIFTGGQVGRWFGIAAAGLSTISALTSISAAPFWGLCVVAIDVLIIYGLAVYGGQGKTV